MKRTNILAFCMAIFLAACSDDNDISNTGNTIQQGSWRVTLFSEDGKDETGKFSGYSFIFGNNGTLTASNGSNVVSGSWAMGNDDSTPKLIISMPPVNDFDELSEDWHILESTSSRIRLQHISGGNGGTDLLTFEK